MKTILKSLVLYKNDGERWRAISLNCIFVSIFEVSKHFYLSLWLQFMSLICILHEICWNQPLVICSAFIVHCSKWTDNILKAKEKNYHREAVSLGSHSLIIVITMLIEYFSCAKNSQDFTFMDVYNFPIIIIKSILLSFYFMVKYKEFEGFEHGHLVKGLWSEHRLTLENLIKYYSI